jgi:hypothetical protein
MKEIKGFTEYFITKCGKVWSNKTNKWLKLSDDKDGYKYVKLHYKCKPFSKRVHRLVAEAYIPNPENKPQVNHIDNDPGNNCVSNLEWCTPGENMKHAAKQGRMSKGAMCKIDETTAKYLLTRINEPVVDLAAELQIPIDVIYYLFHNKTWKHLHRETKKSYGKVAVSKKELNRKPYKLSDSQVLDIIKRKGTQTHQDIANEFNVTKQLVTQILNGKIRCKVTYPFVVPKRWPKTFPIPEGVDTTGWGFS